MKLGFSKLVLIIICLSSGTLVAGTDIGFGTIKGYKIGNGDANTITVYLNEGYEEGNANCKGVATIKYADFEGARAEKRIDQMMSTILAAYMSKKKVRFHSHKDNCDVTFLALQETVY